ncbi:MAG: hypothetical protein ACYSWW_24165, partial [Planctomycetota bacterium]
MTNKFSIENVVRLLVIVAGTTAGSHGQTVSVIPKPVSIEYLDGFFTITQSTRIIAENDAAAEAAKLIDALAPAMG